MLFNSGSVLRTILIIVALLVVAGVGAYTFMNFVIPAPLPPVTPVLLPTPKIQVAQQATPTGTPTPTATRRLLTVTPIPVVPPGGIVYALVPDINSVGWVEEGEAGNHFGESYLYTGVREGVLSIGAMQFDLSFIVDGSTIFLAELELTGLDQQGLTSDSSFSLNILTDEIDQGWSRHNYQAIANAETDETLSPMLEATDMGKDKVNTFIFNAAQRSIIQSRLDSNKISLRLDTLFPEGWFAWDSGYGADTLGRGPLLRLGVVPPAATDVADGPPPGSTPTPTPTFIIITSTPTPENVLTAAAIAPTLTLEATLEGTPTPLPENWVTPLIVTHTPTAENAATAQYLAAELAAAVVAFGTPTPFPANVVLATPTPTETATPIYVLLEGGLPPATPTPTAPITPRSTPAIPAVLIGKIAFKSDRTGQEEIYVMNPDGSGAALLTNRWPYNVAELADTFSADGRFRVFTKDVIRYKDVTTQEGITGVRNDAPAIFSYDSLYGAEQQLTDFGFGYAYNGVWSPYSNQIAFISNDSQDDEIWVVNQDKSGLLRLTETNEAYNAREIGKDTFVPEVNGHPSWSPDGSQVVFWSNRTGQRQIWIMNADGSNPYIVSPSEYMDYDPVWIKYPGVPGNGIQIHTPYLGRHDPFGADRECSDFPSQPVAQTFYWAAGGPAVDLHDLDSNNDGIACN